jgi:hypothetical protein
VDVLLSRGEKCGEVLQPTLENVWHGGAQVKGCLCEGSDCAVVGRAVRQVVFREQPHVLLEIIDLVRCSGRHPNFAGGVARDDARRQVVCLGLHEEGNLIGNDVLYRRIGSPSDRCTDEGGTQALPASGPLLSARGAHPSQSKQNSMEAGLSRHITQQVYAYLMRVCASH